MRIAAVMLLVLLARPARAEIPDVFTGVRRIVAIGDIHGDHDKLVALLRRAGLLDARGAWSGGKAHLVQTGDVLDRGPDSRKSMDLLRRLEGQAQAAGGRVHALIGNHEALNVVGDLRYVSDEEFAAFGDGPRGAPLGREPVGTFPGHRAALGATGPYGKWILGHNAVVKINGTLFLHGGLSPKYASWELRKLNETIRRELQTATDPRDGVSGDPEGPLWYRGLAEPMQPAVLSARLEQIFTPQKALRIVVGHTIQERGIALWQGGQLALIDVGMSRRMLNGPAAALQIEAGSDSAGRLSILTLDGSEAGVVPGGAPGAKPGVKPRPAPAAGAN